MRFIFFGYIVNYFFSIIEKGNVGDRSFGLLWIKLCFVFRWKFVFVRLE